MYVVAIKALSFAGLKCIGLDFVDIIVDNVIVIVLSEEISVKWEGICIKVHVFQQKMVSFSTLIHGNIFAQN